MRNVVVLPQPDGPSSDTNSPGMMWRFSDSTAAIVPNTQSTFLSASLGIAASVPRSRSCPPQQEIPPDEPVSDHHDKQRGTQQDVAERRQGLEVAIFA